MKVKIVTHYQIEDTECNGDYYDIELFIDGKLVKEFGDYYHEKGDVKVEAFLEGIKYATKKKMTVTNEKVADRDY